MIRRISAGGAVLALALVLLAAPPASAHNVDGANPTNYRTRITSVRPTPKDVEVRVVEAGKRLELVNRGDTDVVVIGYSEAKEPYLRIGPRGVFENLRSPATYQNRFRLPSSSVPARAKNPAAPPEWRQVSSDHRARWHDHRAHWMQDRPPLKVRRDPGRTQRIFPWEVPLRRGGEEFVVRGDLTWVPGPSRWPWLALAAGGGLALFLFGRRPGWERVVGVAALAALLGLDVARLEGLASDSATSFVSAAGDNVQALVTWGVGVVAVGRVLQVGLRAAAPLVAAAGVLFALGSVVDLETLSRSQLPSTAPDWLSRLGVAAGLGAGLGLAGAAISNVAARAR